MQQMGGRSSWRLHMWICRFGRPQPHAPASDRLHGAQPDRRCAALLQDGDRLHACLPMVDSHGAAVATLTVSIQGTCLLTCRQRHLTLM